MKECEDFILFNSLDIPVTVSPAAAGGDGAQGRFHGSTASSVPLKVRPEGFTRRHRVYEFRLEEQEADKQGSPQQLPRSAVISRLCNPARSGAKPR
ncbi:hypothetical protein DPX16_8076 [Anabarilius grahami]|uniref:Uncharacterized protein n=1 Tax=Anabarilius grahami TaxID=495550 RepID=A0A3N0XWG7_ANAGA|nr:hypothetical protein DPX16_8076 [Anabarilius grahami]